MKNFSIWNDIERKDFNKLYNNIKCDVLIIGGGITGINILKYLKNENINSILVEQNKICSSITSMSTGKLSFLQNDLIDKIRLKCDDNHAKEYLHSQIESINRIVKYIKKEKIKCDLENVDSICYTNEEDEIDKFKKYRRFIEDCGIKTYDCKNDLVKSKYIFKVKNTYVFNTVKYCLEVAYKYNKCIFEKTCIKRIIREKELYKCYTDKNIIEAKWVVIASHYPYFTLPFLFPFKCNLEKSYVSASKYSGNKISLISYSNPFISVRTYKDYLIYLSNSHLINKDVCDKKHFNELIKKVKDLNLKPDYLWSNIDIMTNDGLPIVGVIKDNILISTGYNTWGLSTSELAGSIIKDIILNNENKYIKLFNPNRDTLHLKFSSIGNNVLGFINGYLYKNKKNFKFCPHLGCKLIYNEVEGTWDCPCHGSRFNNNGTLLSGPSNKDVAKNQIYKKH